MITLDICIPTYNRSKYLDKCLSALLCLQLDPSLQLAIIISDNASTDDTCLVVEQYCPELPIIFYRNNFNIGMARNILTAISYSQSQYYWCIGDDDCLLPGSLKYLAPILNSYDAPDLLWVNSAFTTDSLVLLNETALGSSPPLFSSLPTFSHILSSGRASFRELLAYDKSFDLLGAIFSVISRNNSFTASFLLSSYSHVRDPFSTLFETFPHVFLYTKYLRSTNCFYIGKPLLVSLTSARDWSSFMPIVYSFRIPEIAILYYRSGLPLFDVLYAISLRIHYLPIHFYLVLRRNQVSLINPKLLCFLLLIYLVTPIPAAHLFLKSIRKLNLIFSHSCSS